MRGLSDLIRDRRGAVLMIFALALPMLVFATGMSLDYANAMRIQTRLAAAADAAVLTATSRTLMDAPSVVAERRARDVFRATAGLIPGLRLDPNAASDLAISVSDDTHDGQYRRATIRFSGWSRTYFGGILGIAELAVNGSAGSMAKRAPDIDFYVMLDTSSSMALPTTSAGIALMRAKTRDVDPFNPRGCAFACHQIDPDKPRLVDRDGKKIDYYQLAHDNGIELRIDAGKRAILDLLGDAQRESRVNGATYRFSVSTFDRASDFRNVAPLTDDYALARAGTSAATIIAVDTSQAHFDRQTEHEGALHRQMERMPALGGTGSGQTGDTPQAYVMLITDGMRDEEINGRQLGSMIQTACSAIKGRRIKIAILYTTYQEESVNYHDWSIANIIPLLPMLRPALQQCASSDLMFEVGTDGDISAALNALFQKVIATSRLTD